MLVTSWRLQGDAMEMAWSKWQVEVHVRFFVNHQLSLVFSIRVRIYNIRVAPLRTMPLHDAWCRAAPFASSRITPLRLEQCSIFWARPRDFAAARLRLQAKLGLFHCFRPRGLSKTSVQTNGFCCPSSSLFFLHFFRCFSGENGSFVLEIVQFPRTWCSNHFVSYFEIQILHLSKFFNHFRGKSNLQKNEKRKREERREPQTKQRTKTKPMRSSILHASAILFSSVLVHLCVVNSTVNEWSDSLVVCVTSCGVMQTGKFCKHTRVLCEHFFAWVHAKSRGLAPVSCVYCKPGFNINQLAVHATWNQNGFKMVSEKMKNGAG